MSAKISESILVCLIIVEISVIIISIAVTIIGWQDSKSNPDAGIVVFIKNVIQHKPIVGPEKSYTYEEDRTITMAQYAIIIFGLILVTHVLSDLFRTKKVKFMRILLYSVFVLVMFAAAFYVPSVLSETLKQLK